MYRAYLRPPWPLHQTAAALLTPLAIWGAIDAWSHRQSELGRLYLGDYIRVTLIPDLSAARKLFDFGSHKMARSENQVLICYWIGEREVPAVGELNPALHPHPAIVAMARGSYAAWLRTNIYYGRWPVELVLRPILLGFAFAAVLWTGAWFLDQERRLKFRTAGRQLRGPVMRSRAEFRGAVEGMGIGCRTEERRSLTEWALSLWYALLLRSWREPLRGRLAKFIRIAPELETHHVQMIGDTGSGKTQAILHVTDEAEGFGETCVIYDPHRFGRGYITLPDIEQAFARVKERGEFKRVEHWRDYAPESRYTTPELEAKEHEILAWMAARRGRVGTIAGNITRDEFQEQFRDHLNDGQKWLVWNVIHSEDRMIGVQGLAGAGKTRALATVRDFAERYGYEVRGVAATTTAVAELRAVGIQADTLAAFSLIKEKQPQPRLHLLDEASLTDVHQMSQFLRELRQADRAVVIGDTRQHGSLGAGRVFAELQEAGMQTFELRKIVRQRSESYREVVQHLSQGQIVEALEKLEDEARIHEFADERIRHRAIATWYMRDPQRTLVVSPDNRSRETISDAIRVARAEAGQLGIEVYRSRVLDGRSGVTKEDLRFAGSYRIGDVVVYARASRVGLQKNDRASVLHIDLDKNAVTVMRESDGKTFSYNPRRTGSSATLYEAKYREFAARDRIQFTRALHHDKIANRTLGTIDAIDTAGNVVLRLDDGRMGML